MPYDWMIDVLRDLSRFAQENRMPALVQKLDDASRLAEVEIARRRREVEASSGPRDD